MNLRIQEISIYTKIWRGSLKAMVGSNSDNFCTLRMFFSL